MAQKIPGKTGDPASFVSAGQKILFIWARNMEYRRMYEKRS
jgi:hypothetical protein